VIPPQKNLTHQVRKQKKTENFYIRLKKFNEIFDIRNKINTLQTIKQGEYKNYIFIIVRLRLMIMSNGVSDFVAD